MSSEKLLCLCYLLCFVSGFVRQNLRNGEFSDRVVFQSSQEGDPMEWFNQEHPGLEFINQFTIAGKRYITARIRPSRHKERIATLSEDQEVDKLRRNKKILWVEQQTARIRVPRTTDPEWNNQWYLNGAVTPDMKIADVWASGYKGTGVLIAVLDDGVQTAHPDLINNYDSTRDRDIYGFDLDPNPPSGSSHGTQVSGIIAAEQDNSICISGIAYKSVLIGVRILGNFAISDGEEAQALSHELASVDIYVNSWGPTDGTGFEEPGPLTKAALVDGVTNGRNGKGAIYVWASGNGQTADNCNGDGYVNSIYTIAVSSVEAGKNAWYTEVCAAALTAAYGGSEDDRYLVTTTTNSGCKSTGIQGTSYSTPVIAGIIALVLEANPNLTWRDVQHLIVLSSGRNGFIDSYANWTMNGANREVSQVLGFGFIDASKIVNFATTWQLVPSQMVCGWIDTNVGGATSSHSSNVMASDCQDINYLEHVQTEITFAWSALRGVTEIVLVSPSGTRSQLMHYRNQDAIDNVAAGTLTWTFMSVHFWHENPLGQWTLEISAYQNLATVTFSSWKLKLFGTKEDSWPDLPTHTTQSDETTDSSTTTQLQTTTTMEQTTTKSPTTTMKQTTTESQTTTTKQKTTESPTTTMEHTSTESPTTTMKQTTTESPTTTMKQTTTESPTTTMKQTTTESPTTTMEQTTTESPTTTMDQTTTESPTTTMEQTTTESPTTTMEQTTKSPTTAIKETTTESPTTTIEQTTTESPTTTMEQTTTESPTTTMTQTTTESPTTTMEQTTTESSTTTMEQTTTKSPTTVITETTTESPTTMIKQTTTDSQTTNQIGTTVNQDTTVVITSANVPTTSRPTTSAVPNVIESDRILSYLGPMIGGGCVAGLMLIVAVILCVICNKTKTPKPRFEKDSFSKESQNTSPNQVNKERPFTSNVSNIRFNQAPRYQPGYMNYPNMEYGTHYLEDGYSMYKPQSKHSLNRLNDRNLNNGGNYNNQNPNIMHDYR